MEDKSFETFVEKYNELFEKYNKLKSHDLKNHFAKNFCVYSSMKATDPVKYSLDFLHTIVNNHWYETWFPIQEMEFSDIIKYMLKENIDFVKKPKYKPKKELGSGFFGKVYEIKKGDKIFVQKEMNLPKEFYYANAALNEIQYLQDLKGTKIVPNFIEAYMTDEKIYIVMEKINCGTLQEYMKNKKMDQLPKKDIDEITSLIKKLHQKGFIHKDLHWNNIMVECDKRGNKKRFVLSDLGLTTSIKNIKKNDFQVIDEIGKLSTSLIKKRIKDGKYNRRFQIVFSILWDMVSPKKKPYFRALYLVE